MSDKTHPKNIGISALIDSFGRVCLSPEVKDFLAALNARLVVTYSTGSSKPELEVLDKRGNPVCTIDEFVKLGGYRRWINDELKAHEKEQASNEKVALVALFLRKAEELNLPMPLRIEETNESRFRQYSAMASIAQINLGVIEGTINSTSRTYLLEKGRLLVRSYHKCMLLCMSAAKLEKEILSELLFECGVPKWLHAKFVDKNFTTNVKHDAIVLLFPKGNYTRGIALSTRELRDEGFLNSNRAVMHGNGSIIAFAKHDWSALLPSVPEHLETVVGEFLNDFMWTLISPYTVEELLLFRTTGKTIPIFRAKILPNTGANNRPENESQRICRDMHNSLTELNVTWLHLMNLVVPCAKPREEFWSRITGPQTWEITPSHTIYHNLVDFGTNLSCIKTLSNRAVLALMGEVTLQSIRILKGSEPGRDAMTFFNSLYQRADYRVLGAPKPVVLLDVDLTAMQQVVVTQEVTNRTKEFLGARPLGKPKDRKKYGSNVKLTTAVLRELAVIDDEIVYNKVKGWITSSFKTGQHTAVQLLAAERIAGEFLDNKGKLLADDFDEYEYLRNFEDEDVAEE